MNAVFIVVGLSGLGLVYCYEKYIEYLQKKTRLDWICLNNRVDNLEDKIHNVENKVGINIQDEQEIV